MGIENEPFVLRMTELDEEEIYDFVRIHYPTIGDILLKLKPLRWKGSVFEFQASILYFLMRWYDFPGAKVLEIGTYYGYTAAIMAEAAPSAKIITLNPTKWEWEKDRENLMDYKNVTTYCAASWDFYKTWSDPFCFIFVDGDHKQVERDLVWWNMLEPGGIMLFHDYSPKGSPKACPPVYRVMERLRKVRDPDILIVDNRLIGMIGWRKRSGEILDTGSKQ